MSTMSEESGHSKNEYEPPCVKESSSAYEGHTCKTDVEADGDLGATALPEQETCARDEKDERESDESSLASTINLEAITSMLEFTIKKLFDYVENEVDEKARLFSIKRKHINFMNELNSKYSPENDYSQMRACHRPFLMRVCRCKIIPWDFEGKNHGLSMSIMRRNASKICFAFKHSKAYQQYHTLFTTRNLISTYDVYDLDLSSRKLHIEGLIMLTEKMFRSEKNIDIAIDIIEQSVAYLQYLALPSFNLLDLRTRLEYKYVENRPFHILLLKFIYLLSKRACHRTALELSKVLLNLDPSDPLAVKFIIDVMAFRAREYEWLLDTIAYLEKENMLKYMFNLMFSRALAKFLISQPKSEMLVQSNNDIQDALLAFPWFLDAILYYTNYEDKSALKLELFSDYANKTTPLCLKHMIGLYACFTEGQWRVPSVMEWLLQNAALVNKSFCNELKSQVRSNLWENSRLAEYTYWPQTIHRHLIVISPMAGYLDVRSMPYVTCNESYDPLPPSNGVISSSPGRNGETTLC